MASRSGGLPASDPKTRQMRGGQQGPNHVFKTPPAGKPGGYQGGEARVTGGLNIDDTPRVATQEGGAANPGQSGGTAGGSPQGLFNFQSIMDQFYNWKPKDDDVAGQQLKNTFQGDFIQTVLNNQMSKDLAYTNAEIATGQMTTAAALELANQTAIMADEHKYGQIKMGAEYDYQSKFATDEANRKLNEMSHGADLQQNQTKLEGEENRLNLKQQGVNDMNLQDSKNKGAIDQLKQSGLNDQQIQDMKNKGALQQIEAQGGIEKWMQTEKGKQMLDQIDAQGNMDISKIKASGDEALKQIDAQGNVEQKLQGMKGEQMLEQLREQGVNEQALQELKNSGALDQIAGQGDIDKALQELKNTGALDQIGASGAEALKQIKAQGFLDNELQKLKGDQAIDQIGAQGDVDVKKIDAQGALDQAMQNIKGKQAMEQIGAQGNIDKDMLNTKGKQAVEQIGAQGNVDLSKIKETGNQERLGMEQATKEDTKKQKRDSGMARSLAGMF